MDKVQLDATDYLLHRTCLQSFVRLSCCGLFLVLLSSCTTVPERTTPPAPSQTSSQIIERLQAREAQVVSLKGLFHAEIDGKGMAFSHSLEGSIFYQRPDRFRIKGFTRFGGLVFDFALSGVGYALRVQDHPRPIISVLDNFQRLGELRLPVLLSLRAIEVLLGKLRLNAERVVAMKERENTYQFDIPSDLADQEFNAATFSQRILIDRVSLQVRQLDYIDSNGESVASIQTSDFRRVRDRSPNESATILLPFVVQAEDRVEAGSIALEFREIIANEPLDERLFSLTAF